MNKISIPEPCGENISAMSKCHTGRHCAVCKRDLLDLRQKDLESVHAVLEKNPGACIIVQQRHTTAVSNKRVAWINRFETFLHQYKMAALASILIPVMLFVSGCHSRKKPHYVGKFKTEQPALSTQQDQQ